MVVGDNRTRKPGPRGQLEVPPIANAGGGGKVLKGCLIAVEEAYRQGHPTYQPNASALDNYSFSPGVTLAAPIDAGPDGWTATVKRSEVDVQCTISVGDRVPAGSEAGTPVCSRPGVRAP